MPPKVTVKNTHQPSLKGIFIAIAIGLSIVILSSMVWITYPTAGETVNGSSCPVCENIVSLRPVQVQYGIPFGYYTHTSYEKAGDMPFTVSLILPGDLLTIMQQTSAVSSSDISDSSESATVVLEEPLSILYNILFWSALCYLVTRYLIPTLKSWRLKKKV